MSKNQFIFNGLAAAGLLAAVAYAAGCGGSPPAGNAVAAERRNETNKNAATAMTDDNRAEKLPAFDAAEIPTVLYCDLIENAAAYDKKIVRVRAVYFSAFERIYMYDERCEPNQPPAAPEKIPAETWAERDKTSVFTGDSDEARMNRRLNGFGRKDVTVIGRFHSAGEQSDPNKPTLFGHVGCCRFQLSIMRVERVTNLDQEIEKSANDYGKPVKYVFRQKLDFPDFTLEYLRDPQILVAKPVYPFKVSRKDKEIIVRKDGLQDNAPLRFEFGGASYLLELGVWDKSGRLASDELIITKTP